jgi:hypothetical protein
MKKAIAHRYYLNNQRGGKLVKDPVTMSAVFTEYDRQEPKYTISIEGKVLADVYISCLTGHIIVNCYGAKGVEKFTAIAALANKCAAELEQYRDSQIDK